MALRQTLEALDLLDSAHASGERVAAALRARGLEATTTTIQGERGETDFVRVAIPGTRGRQGGGPAPTLGIIGRLGGIGARPHRIGLVSDGDGAVVAVACALRVADMRREGDDLPGDLLVATHVCPRAHIRETPTVPMMASPVDVATMNRHEVDPAMEAILSVDTTRGNRLVNHRGIAITPPVKEGYILRVPDGLLDLYQWVTGRVPVIVPLTTQDITPYGTGLRHINSIVQPAVATGAPVVGVALTAEVAVPGSATGASPPGDMETAVRFCLEVAKAYGAGELAFYDRDEYAELLARYGPMRHLQTLGHVYR
ncbi:MAG: DUF1177 domain-containing protein [Armatimonadota bacterium]|nr:DUF1177 domain-containing protein [Armatimonadota bacterium]MDR7422524.1 DUF1177 domain-containing protein [Armatimonadota bacterium]MDR7455245.1 DUF1177 domain-containing protein [Armatimonadota bacterium]MDR7457453.1 DUF1177 domain-containing protein [Armatimonadota bacterium]MDR7496556.1 DUF1177 domain-containing protein [Armatimonadota bacterium]